MVYFSGLKYPLSLLNKVSVEALKVLSMSSQYIIIIIIIIYLP